MDGISYKKWMERAAGLFLSALIAVLLTMLFLAVFAFAMLKGNLSASVEKIGLIVMSVMACFVGGFLCGKKNIKKRYLWGLGVGVLYCLFFGGIHYLECNSQGHRAVPYKYSPVTVEYPLPVLLKS